mgnify:CR=1 FL=1
MIDTDKLKQLRLEKGLSQKEVAKYADISRAYYTMIENGDRTPSMRVMQNIVKLFGPEAKDIFFNDEVA